MVDRATGEPVAEVVPSDNKVQILGAFATCVGRHVLCNLPPFLAFLHRDTAAMGRRFETKESAGRIPAFVKDYGACGDQMCNQRCFVGENALPVIIDRGFVKDFTSWIDPLSSASSDLMAL